MEPVLASGARQDLERFDRSDQEYIFERLRELEDRPVKHEGSEVIQVQGRELFRYRMKENDTRGDRDYRAVYDISGSSINVLAIFHRDKGYVDEDIARRF